ncbi:hypothetical protein [Henriciella aquimarina]|uniref:hypothetical protein n=1 Tax=Henriciella aquimarina TaxID=545261 RepID=UPI0009FEE65C|nr:hypothetical protein [Henriciella aquimarina]
MWQLGVGLAHFIHATVDISIPSIMVEPTIVMRTTSAVAAFLAGLAALTERKGGAWLAGISTFLFACVTLEIFHGNYNIDVWRDDYIYLSILTVLFLTLVVFRREEAEREEGMTDALSDEVHSDTAGAW